MKKDFFGVAILAVCGTLPYGLPSGLVGGQVVSQKVCGSLTTIECVWAGPPLPPGEDPPTCDSVPHWDPEGPSVHRFTAYEGEYYKCDDYNPDLNACQNSGQMEFGVDPDCP